MTFYWKIIFSDETDFKIQKVVDIFFGFVSQCFLVLWIPKLSYSNKYIFFQFALVQMVECPFQAIVSTTTEISGIDIPIAHMWMEILNWPGYKTNISTSHFCNILERSRAMSSFPMWMWPELCYLLYRSFGVEPYSNLAYMMTSLHWLSLCPRCTILNYLLWEVSCHYLRLMLLYSMEKFINLT